MSRSELSCAICSSASTSACSPPRISFSSCSNSSSMLSIAIRILHVDSREQSRGSSKVEAARIVWAFGRSACERWEKRFERLGEQPRPQLQHAGERDVHPRWTVVEFVGELVQRFVQ